MPAGDILYALLLLGFLGVFVAVIVLAIVHVWRRPDWSRITKIVVTVLLLVLSWVGVTIYGIFDVVTRRDLSGGIQAGWVVAMIFVPIVGVPFYLIWAIQNPETSLLPDAAVDILPGAPQGP